MNDSVTHSRCTCFITGWISLLEWISCMIQTQIQLKQPIFATYRRNYVIDKSTFEVSNYFQKVMYSILIATVHRVYIWTINVYPSTSVIWMFVTEIMILCGWKDCEVVSFQTDDSCSLQVSSSANADLNVQITLMWSYAVRQRWRNETDGCL